MPYYVAIVLMLLRHSRIWLPPYSPKSRIFTVTERATSYSAICAVRRGGNALSIQKNNTLLSNARGLRRRMTKQERHLWYDFLRPYPAKFYKQRIIDNYIVDFYCHQAKLVIELDGSQHYTTDGQQYDHQRTKTLEKYDLLVLRFSNKEVEEQFEGVCTKIDQVIRERCGPLSHLR